MLKADDVTQMQADVTAMIADGSETITIRRGGSTLAPQTVRIARRRSGRAVEGTQTAEARAGVVVVGDTSFDVQPGDRFNDASGALYEVVAVRPNRRFMVVAEAELVE